MTRSGTGRERSLQKHTVGLAVLLIGSEGESAHVNASAWIKVNQDSRVMHSC